MKDKSIALGLLALCGCIPFMLLGGCSEYMMRDDRIALSAGDAIAANKAAHINDPWPREGFDTRPKTIGERVVVPLQRYRSGQPPARANQGAPGSAPAATGATMASSTTGAAGN